MDNIAHELAIAKTPRRKVTIFVPVYNNSGSLTELADRLVEVERSMCERGLACELLFVEDGSHDDSFAKLLRIKDRFAECRVVRHSRNFGAIQGWKTASHWASGDCLVPVAADLQEPVELIVELVDHWLKGADFVVATRRSRADPIGTRVTSALFYALVRRLAVRNYPKGGFDFSLFDRKLVEYLKRVGKNTNPQMFLVWLGFEPVEVPYDRAERRHGHSQWRLGRKLVLVIDSILGFSMAPLRLLALFGMICCTLSLTYALVIVVLALLGFVEVPGFATIVSLVLFFGGAQLAMTGIIGEYIWRILDELNGRPESVVEGVY